MIRIAISALCVAAPFVANAAEHDAPIIGRATVIDGDTVDIRGERIRINGVDAPESTQLCKDATGQSYHCGSVTAKALAGFIAVSSPTRCEFVTFDKYERVVGNCFRADGKSLAAFLVRNGLALDWPKYSKGAYAVEQQKAKRDKRGFWSGEFTAPWEWRAELRSKGEVTSSLPSRDCKIKGNISREGVRIYHVPGQRDYLKTRISESKGERWFCSETQAQAAGWQASRR